MEVGYTRPCSTGRAWSSADYRTVVSAAGLVRGLQVRTESKNGESLPGFDRLSSLLSSNVFHDVWRREVSDLGALNRVLLRHGEAEQIYL